MRHYELIANRLATTNPRHMLLVHQPEEAWEYGVSIDWAGIVLERVTGQSLNEYFHHHIFEPLAFGYISMVPTKEVKKNLAFMLSGGSTGRSLGTAQWSGRWWCDREKRVAGIVCAQVLPFGDAQVFQLSQGIETGVYNGLGLSL